MEKKKNYSEIDNISSDEIIVRIFKEKKESREKFLEYMKTKDFQKMLEKLDSKPIRKHVQI